ncbi:cytosolic carboxypeptidase-like protein 5 [Diprion similis]|uniref:cytosolic carboxypeptidase-like protein 5 n=1 Tax=Diprion similis TaxID=362088 RepID=UPI001EF8AF48|nr:cytosolic carboxypeptidase-like protein 5 [Diprion similis]
MATTTEEIKCGNFLFYNTFDSANLAKVEQVKAAADPPNNGGVENDGKTCKSSNSDEVPDYEFNVWTKHDCHGTDYQNTNRTWFYFGIQSPMPGVLIKINVVNLNKQLKMFSQGMCPVYKTVPGHPQWERIRDKPTFSVDQKGSEFILSFVFRTAENIKAITYIAFTYPFSYTDLQNFLKKIDAKMTKKNPTVADDIYYQRECAIMSLEGRRLDLITISSHHNISTEREARLNRLFPIKEEERPFKFRGKKVILVSARVHPGETPSTFVFNGFLNLLLNRDDPVAINLRRLYVFKLIPMLNPDGVANGHYRMDTRGVNLNRVYLNPSFNDHPTIYAARAIIRYHHYNYEIPEDESSSEKPLVNINLEVGQHSVNVIGPTGSVTNVIRDTTNRLLQQVTLMTLDEKSKGEPDSEKMCKLVEGTPIRTLCGDGEDSVKELETKVEKQEEESTKKSCTAVGIGRIPTDPEASGLFLYIDLHGHASKKGVFMYGNYFDDAEDTIMCMLLPKLMSINNANFHFTSCNFAERNMYLIDKRDGMSREGSGRVAVYKLTGLVRSYTLECNYNSGRMVNSIPARVRDGVSKNQNHIFVPPKYSPSVFEEVGTALGPSILDLTTSNPNSRLPNSQYRSLRGVRSYLKLTYVNLASSFNRPLNKNSSGVISTDQSTIEPLEVKQNCVPDEDGSNSLKSDINLAAKSNKIRRASSIYTNVKRIMSSRRTRPITSHRMYKNQDCSKPEEKNVSSNMRLSSIAVRKKLLKSADYIPSITSNVANIRSTLGPPKMAKHKRTARKLSVSNYKHEITSDESSVVKHNSKRLKIISPKIVKTRPEIGESSKSASSEKAISKMSSRAYFLCNKQNTKNVFSRTRKPFVKIEQTKLNKSSKMKLKRKNSLIISKLSGNEVNKEVAK